MKSTFTKYTLVITALAMMSNAAMADEDADLQRALKASLEPSQQVTPYHQQRQTIENARKNPGLLKQTHGDLSAEDKGALLGKEHKVNGRKYQNIAGKTEAGRVGVGATLGDDYSKKLEGRAAEIQKSNEQKGIGKNLSADARKRAALAQAKEEIGARPANKDARLQRNILAAKKQAQGKEIAATAKLDEKAAVDAAKSINSAAMLHEKLEVASLKWTNATSTKLASNELWLATINAAEKYNTSANLKKGTTKESAEKLAKSMKNLGSKSFGNGIGSSAMMNVKSRAGLVTKLLEGTELTAADKKLLAEIKATAKSAPKTKAMTKSTTAKSADAKAEAHKPYTANPGKLDPTLKAKMQKAIPMVTPKAATAGAA